ncbi:LacI family DNA-binding transcriptional regulator [Acrocarpospora catenulata]|uniref:LacI family DNA-binding transcriptional regulator n=1 Tax=Acrocarpospora catenulata TaxID=2836182 RepID=UPI001BD9133D|nr:LacI family DNA-binding transcriptional regulator [Acrocarpospora catenulata]
MADEARREMNAAAPPTATDVAKVAGVSRQTVANVIQAPHRVRPETRAKVEAIIEQLGYRPNRAAQALKFSASRTIGFRIQPIAPGALNSMYDRFLHALAEAGHEADRQFLIYTAPDAAAEIEVTQRLHRSGSADAFVLYDIAADDLRPAALLDLGVPFVAFGRTDLGGETYTWIDVDNLAGIASAVDHLVHRGHRRIAFVGWPDGTTIGDRRARGWRDAVARHGLQADCAGLDARCDDSATAAAEQAFGLLSRAQPPTAFVAATDTLAVGVMRACQRWGLDVGRDVAITGFDDTPTAAALELSSIRQPIETVGRALMSALLGEHEGGQLLQPQLVIRASSAAPAPR